MLEQDPSSSVEFPHRYILKGNWYTTCNDQSGQICKPAHKLAALSETVQYEMSAGLWDVQPAAWFVQRGKDRPQKGIWHRSKSNLLKSGEKEPAF